MMNKKIILTIFAYSTAFIQFVASQSNCGLKCLDCKVDNVCNKCEDNFIYSSTLGHCVSKCSQGQYYSEDSKTCTPLCESSYYNNDEYNLCTKFDDCAIVEEYGQQYFDSITASVLTPTSYIVAGSIDSTSNTDFSLKIFSRETLKLSGMMVAHTSKVINLQLIKDSSNVSFNSDQQYLISFSSNELVLWDLSRGYAEKKITFDKYVTTQQNSSIVYFIDETILILFKNEIEFGIFFLDRLKTCKDQEIVTIRLVAPIHAKNIKGFIRTGNQIISYSMDSNIYSYDMTMIYQTGTSPATLVCQIQNSKYVEKAQAFSTGELVFFLSEEKQYVFYDKKTCTNVDVGHAFNIIQIIIDEATSTKTKFIFSLSTYKVILSKVFVDIVDTPVPNTVVQTVQKLQERKIDKSFAFISQNMLMLIDFNGFVLMITYGQERLEENYSATLMWQTNFALTSAIVDPVYSNLVLFGKGIILLRYDTKRASLYQVDITKNIPRSQKKPTDKINGMILDTLYNRLIIYSDDGSLKAYERIDIYKNNYRIVINKYHPDCNILDNNTCQNKLMDVQMITTTLYAALYSDSSIILWTYTFTDFELFKKIGLEDTSIIQTMNYNINTNILVYQSPQQLRMYNTLTNNYIGTIVANSTVVSFQYAYTEVYKSVNCVYVCDFKNKRVTVYSTIAPYKWQVFSATYSTKKPYVTAKYYASHRQIAIISDTSLSFYNPTLTKTTISLTSISGFISNSIILNPSNFSASVKNLIFMRNLQVFSYLGTTKKAQYTSATNVQDYQTAYGYINSQDVFAFFQNSGVTTIQNQVVIISGVTLNFQHILTFQDKISTLTIDSTNSKLYIGFENGQVYSGFIYTDYEIWLSPSTIVPIGMSYSSKHKLFFYYKSEIRVLSSVNYAQLQILNGKHTSNLVGFYYSELKKSILSCSSDTLVNMGRWDISNLTTPVFTEMKNDTPKQLSKCFLDDVNNISIGYYTPDQLLVYWDFTSGSLIYSTDAHKLRSNELDAGQVDVDPLMKISYTITQFQIDTNLQRLIMSNNMEEIHMHSYATNAQANTYIKIPKIIKYYIDTYKQRLLVLIQQEYTQTFYSYSYSGATIEFLKEFQYHTSQVKGIIFQGERAFSYEETRIKVMNRSTYELLTTIVCVNPLITNFLIFEKLSYVIIWSDFEQGVFNQSIGIYNLLTGTKVADVLGYQSIETGNIHKIIIDEDSYQLIISKNNPNNYFYTVDLRTFYYTAYYANKNYTTSIRDMFIMKESNQLVYLDQKEIRVMMIENSINTKNNYLPITDIQNIDQFYNKDEKQLYYIDALEESWQLNTLTKQLLYKIPFTGVRYTNYQNDYFYVVQQKMVNKFNRNFVSIGTVEQISTMVLFSTDYMFIVNYKNELYIVDLNSFKPYFFSSFDSTIQQMYINESLEDLFVLQTTKVMTRFNFLSKEKLYTFTDLTLDFIVIDKVNKIILQAHSDNRIQIFYAYKKEILDYQTGQPKIIITPLPSRIFKILVDTDFQKMYILYNSAIPIMQVYSYIYNSTIPELAVPNLINIINLPSRSPAMTLSLKENYLFISLPWQLIQIDRSTLQYLSIIRDNQILYSQQKIKSLGTSDDLYLVQSHNSIAMYNNNNQKLTNLFTFQLAYPNIVSQTIIDDKSSYRLDILGISSGIIFQYNFVVPKIGADLKPLYNIDSCFHQMTDIQYGFQVEQQMITLDKSAKRLSYNLYKTLIEIESENGFFYHKYMSTYNSNIVYKTDPLIQEKEIILRDDTFAKLLQPRIILSHYNFNIKKGQKIVFSSINKKISFINIKITQNSKNFGFVFDSQEIVVLNNVNIDGLEFQGDNPLFSFINCDSVQIDTLNIVNTSFGGGNFSLLSFTNVKNIQIINLNVTNFTLKSDSTAENIIYISNSNIFKMSSSTFDNIQSLNSNKIWIKSYGILQSIIDHINTQNIKQVSFMNSENYFTLDDQTVYLYSDTTSLSGITFYNITSLTQSLISFNGNSLQIFDSNFKLISCETCTGGSLKILKTKIFQVKDSEFVLNQATQGGAIAFMECGYSNLKVIDSIFTNCTALAQGGAILSSKSDIMVNRTSIKWCSSQIGGAIRYTEIEPLFVYYKSKYEQTKNPIYYIENNIKDNTAQIYGQNIGSYPKTILIKSKNSLIHNNYRILSSDSDQFNLDLYSLSNFQSSAEISFEFQILDQELNPIFFDLSLYEKSKYPQIISNEITQFNIKASPGTDDVKIFGQYITDYFQFNQKTQTFAINQMMVIANPSTSNHIFFETPSIKKVLNPTDTSRQFSDGPFHIRLNIQFRQCIRGEVYKLSGSIFYCQECKEGSYSIVEPIKQDYETQLCLRCPDEASYCYRDQMVLFPGYWKRTNNTDQIVYCTNKPENCEGVEEQGYCILGHIGPLCEACDVYGKVWEGEYQNDGKFGCIDCTKLRKASYVLPTLFIALGIIVYILISIRIALQISRLIVIGYYLRRLNILAINKSSFQDTTNMNLKAMMHYMQISSMINTFVIKLPEWMTFVPDYLGSPVENMLYTFDCYLNKASQNQYPIIFLRTIWFLAVPVLYLAIVGIFYWILVMFRLAKYDKSYIISGLVFLCFFTQPNMVSNLLGVMSCRIIDDKYYIQSDISFECYTDIHLQYIGIVCFPGLILWGAIIPFFILRKLIQNKDQLDNASIRLKYGFLYQDYKHEHFYWEFVRIYTKLLVIGILSFYGDPYTNKLVIILVLFLIYQVALIKFQPYQMKYFQNIDKTSMIVFIILLIMNIFLYNHPDQVQSQIFYIVLIIISNGYQFILLLEVIKAKISVKFKKQYNQVMSAIIKLFPFTKKFITINKPIPMKTFQHWLKVKFFLNECSERKVYNEKNNVQFGKSSDIGGNPEQRFLQPSKRNRMRLFNQNLQLSNSKNNIMNPDNMIFSEELSYRNGQQMAKLRENQPLSVDRFDSNYNQLLSPKMIGSFSHLSDKTGQDQVRDDVILEFDDHQSSQQYRKISYGQLLRSLFNYADVEEEEDERRMQKKAAIHHEYRLYQKTDLLRKNLKPIEIDESKLTYEIPHSHFRDDQNPDINDSVHDLNEVKYPKGRYAKNLAPRILLSQERLDESTKNESSSKKDPFSDILKNGEEEEISEALMNRNQYNQIEKNNVDNLNRDQKEELEDPIMMSPEDLEEDEDNRRMMKKATFQHDFNIQRKANLIYKNLIQITYEPDSNQPDIVSNDENVKEDKSPKSEKNCDINDSLLSLEDNDKIQNKIPDNKVLDGIQKIHTIQEQHNISEKALQKLEEQLLVQPPPSQQIQLEQKYLSLESSATQQVQDIINFRAQNQMSRGVSNEIIHNNYLQNENKQSTTSSLLFSEINDLKRGSTSNGDNHEKFANKQTNKIINDIILEDDFANIEEDEDESQGSGKDNLTETKHKQVQPYFDTNTFGIDQNNILQQPGQKITKKVEFQNSSPTKTKFSVSEDQQSAIPEHNDDFTLFKNGEFSKQFTNLETPNGDNPQSLNFQMKKNDSENNSEDFDISSISKSNPSSQQIIQFNNNIEDQIMKPSVFSQQKDGIVGDDQLINLDENDD